MKLKTMRAVDYWIGIPMCFVGTMLVRLLGTPKGPEKPQRVLFVELSEMGSTVIANPALEKTKRELGAEIFFLIFERNVDCLRLLPTVPEGNIVTIRETSLFALALDTLRFLRWVRKAKIDTVVDMELFSRYSGLLTGLSGAKRRVGFHRFHAEGLYRGEMLTHRVNYNGHIHMAKNFICMVNALLAPKPEVPYSKTFVSDEEIRVPIQPVTEDEKEFVRGLIRQVYPEYRPDFHRVVLINPNSSELLPQRRWDRDRYCMLAAMIANEWDDVLVLITGSPAERAEALRMQEKVNHARFRSFAGMHKLIAINALYNIAEVLVSNDSGPAHFSAIAPIRSIVLFGPETPKLYGSLGNTEAIWAELSCSPCVTAANQKNSACNDAVCMKLITPERVLESVRGVLNGTAARRRDVVPVGALRSQG
ncbi:MAG TPA: glycosyltransferase family 9 protein [Terracidiphilus sp.]|jgi:ADP-heptose:LPS heptosyltransferase|nr:glycosyltransferase family 9 protein [Terracidiphilus sp.]